MFNTIKRTVWLVPLCACLFAFSVPALAEDVGTGHTGYTTQEDVGTGTYGYTTQEDVGTGSPGYTTQEDVGTGTTGAQTQEDVGTGTSGTQTQAAHRRARLMQMFQLWFTGLYRGYF